MVLYIHASHWSRNQRILNEPSSNNLQEQNIQAELDYVKLQSENARAIQEEAQELRYKRIYKFWFEFFSQIIFFFQFWNFRERLANSQNSLNLNMGEKERLAEELTRQQALYTELKKMRGRGEEMDMLQQLEQVLIQDQQVISRLIFRMHQSCCSLINICCH